MTTLTAKQQELLSLLDTYLLYPPKTQWLSGDESERRIRVTKQYLTEATEGDPESLHWLATRESFNQVDSFNFYFEAHVLSVRLLGLQDKTGEYLLSLAMNHQAEWYVRRESIKQLSENKTIEPIKKLITLLDFQFDEDEPDTEILETLLDVFVKHEIREALPAVVALQKRHATHQRQTEDSMSFLSSDLFVSTRAGLGDESVLVKAIRFSYDPWHHRRTRAEQGLKQLQKHLSEEKVFSLLSDHYTSEEAMDRYLELARDSMWPLVRRWSLDQYLLKKTPSTSATPLIPLLDNNWYVASQVSEYLITAEVDENILQSQLKSDDLPNEAKYWLVYILLKRGIDISAITQPPGLQISLPKFVNDEMRHAIVQEWSDQTQPRSDIRWIIEGLTTKTVETYDSEARIKQLIKRLEQQGIKVNGYQDYADEMQQGGSTYFVVKMQSDTKKESVDEDGEREVTVIEDWICVSKLGPFIDYQRHQKSDYYDENNQWTSGMSGGAAGIQSKKIDQIYKDTIEELGFQWLNDEVLNYVVPGLNIYFFGNREPLSIRDLLFYWQD